jgi:hypothetical protein
MQFSTQVKNFPPRSKIFHPGQKFSTQVKNSPPRSKILHPGQKFSTHVKNSPPRSKILHPGQKFSTQVKKSEQAKRTYVMSGDDGNVTSSLNPSPSIVVFLRISIDSKLSFFRRSSKEFCENYYLDGSVCA